MINEKLVNVCDKIMVVSFCAMIFFLPFYPAFIEALYVIAFLAFIVKRVHLCKVRKVQGRFQFFLEIFRPQGSSLDQPLFWYVLIAFLSIFLSYTPVTSMKGFVFKLLQDVYTYFMFVEVMYTRKRMLGFMFSFLASIGIVVFNGILQLIFHCDFINHYMLISDMRVTSSFKHSNDLGGYLASVIPWLIAILFFMPATKFADLKSEVLEKISHSKRFRFAIFVVLAAALVCLSATYSRASWIGFAVGTLFLVFRRSKRIIAVLTLVFFSLGVFCFSFKHDDQLKLINKTKIFSGSGREEYWMEAINMIKDHPVLGVGINAYSIVARDYKISWGGYPHNCYLQMAAELGILGIGAFFWILVCLWQKVRGFMRNSSDMFCQIHVLGLTAGLLGYLVQSFFDTTMYSVNLGTLLWLLFAGIYQMTRVAKV